jgi:hypothetical protein
VMGCVFGSSFAADPSIIPPVNARNRFHASRRLAFGASAAAWRRR